MGDVGTHATAHNTSCSNSFSYLVQVTDRHSMHFNELFSIRYIYIYTSFLQKRLQYSCESQVHLLLNLLEQLQSSLELIGLFQRI